MAGYYDGCSYCTSLTVSTEYKTAFHVKMCNACRMTDYGKLITKTQAKQRFAGIITDKDFHGLGSVERPNPFNKQFKPMKMYLLSQVEDVVLRKQGGGSLDEIEFEVRRNEEERIAARVKRKAQQRDGNEAEDGDKNDVQLEKQVEKYLGRKDDDDDDDDDDRIQQEIRDTFARRIEGRHRDVTVDEKTGKKQRIIEGGPIVDVEEI